MRKINRINKIILIAFFNYYKKKDLFFEYIFDNYISCSKKSNIFKKLFKVLFFKNIWRKKFLKILASSSLLTKAGSIK